MVLYSTGCPRCRVLKAKLDKKGIEYIENSSVDEMMELGIEEVPMLDVGDKLLGFAEAVQWVNDK